MKVDMPLLQRNWNWTIYLQTIIWYQVFQSNINHHHVAPSARISLTLSLHPSLSSITSGRSSGPHPVSTQSCCILDQASRPAFARPCERVHRSTFLMSSSLFLQKYPACLVLVFNGNNYIWYKLFVCTQLNGFAYCYIKVKI